MKVEVKTKEQARALIEGRIAVEDRLGDRWYSVPSERAFEAFGPWHYYDDREPEVAEVKTEAQPDPLPLPADPKKFYGATKPEVGLIPPVAKLHCALALEDGASKYGFFNWRSTQVELMTYLNAAYRHLDAFLDGEDNTRDTDIHNLGAVMACCAIILDAMSVGTMTDNRPPKGRGGEVQDQLKAWKAAKKGTP